MAQTRQGFWSRAENCPLFGSGGGLSMTPVDQGGIGRRNKKEASRISRTLFS
jgi:hypothetical protein